MRPARVFNVQQSLYKNKTGGGSSEERLHGGTGAVRLKPQWFRTKQDCSERSSCWMGVTWESRSSGITGRRRRSDFPQVCFLCTTTTSQQRCLTDTPYILNMELQLQLVIITMMQYTGVSFLFPFSLFAKRNQTSVRKDEDPVRFPRPPVERLLSPGNTTKASALLREEPKC